MPEYINHNSHTVHLTGEDGKTVRIKSRQRILLSEYFDRYCSRGFIRRTKDSTPSQVSMKKKPQQLTLGQVRQKKIPRKPKNSAQLGNDNIRKQINIQKARKIVNASRIKRKQSLETPKTNKFVVGKRLSVDPNELLQKNLDSNIFPLSNNIGVGILSYNRASSLKRLIGSIVKFTNLKKTTVFISDDGSTEQETIDYLDALSKDKNFVILRNPERGGIAVNTNRLLRCLSRFKNCLLLNDDVEVLQPTWEYFYPEVMYKTGMHHLIYRQPGVYGASLGEIVQNDEISLRMNDKKPQGAVLAFTNEMLLRSGHFDESYGLYGMEHVDWSMRAWEFDLQSEGFFDVEGSSSYFKIHDDFSAVEDRADLLKGSKKLFANRESKASAPTEKSEVPAISYVIPLRNIGRDESIRTVVSNIRSQRFPSIEIILVEQDSQSRIEIENYDPVDYHFADGSSNKLFNKSLAFNLGVSKVETRSVILHDADMLVQGDYTTKVFETLDEVEACHLGGTVVYTTQSSAEQINITGEIDKSCKCERVVGYFEGGSLACTVSAYWQCGAFNEDFWGYGCEDCDFYSRLASRSWKENRIFDFLHMWHGRVEGWDDHHKINRDIESSLKSLDMNTRISKQYNQLRKNGYSEFLGRKT